MSALLLKVSIHVLIISLVLRQSLFSFYFLTLLLESISTCKCSNKFRIISTVFGVDLTTLVMVYDSKRPAVVDACITEVENRGM